MHLIHILKQNPFIGRKLISELGNFSDYATPVLPKFQDNNVSIAS